MGETRPEISAVDVELLLARNVDVLAAGAVHLHSAGRQLFRNADRQYVLSLAKNTWAGAKATQHELLLHHGQASRRENESGVDEPVEIHSRLVNFEEILIV